MTRTSTLSFAIAMAAVALLLLLEQSGGSTILTSSSHTTKAGAKSTTASGNSSNKVSCKSDADCSSSPGWYCNLNSKRCTCQLFHNGTKCLPVFCKEQFDCMTAEKENNAGFFYTCDKNGKCQCRLPRVLSKNGAECENPLWADILGWSALVIAGLCVLVCCYCVMFGFDKKQAAARAGASKRSSIRGAKSSTSKG